MNKQKAIKWANFMPVDLRFFEHRKTQALIKKFGPGAAYCCLLMWSEMYQKGGVCDLSDDLFFEHLQSNCSASAEQVHAIVEHLVKYKLIEPTKNPQIFTKADVADNLAVQADISEKRSASAKQMHSKRNANAQLLHAEEKRRDKKRIQEPERVPVHDNLSVPNDAGIVPPSAFGAGSPLPSNVHGRITEILDLVPEMQGQTRQLNGKRLARHYANGNLDEIERQISEQQSAGNLTFDSYCDIVVSFENDPDEPQEEAPE